MSEWKTVSLGDVCEIQSGGTPSRSKQEYWKNGNIPWIKIGDFSGKYLSQSSEFITEEGLNNSSAKLFSKGTILYSIFATLGEVTILDIDASTNQAIAGIGIKSNTEIDIDFFYSYLKSLKDEVNRIGRGVAQNNINLSILRDFKIPLPPLETQKQIASILDKCTSVIEKYKKMLEKYDTLIKSRFIDLFGDPILNPMEWEISNLGKFIENANNGMARRGNDKNGKIVLRLVELQRGFLDYSECNRIEIKSNEEKYLLKNNDFLFARVNGNPDNVGRCCYYKDIGENVYHNDHIIRIHFDENILNEYFLNTLLNSDYGKSEFKKYIKTSAGQYTIAQDGISSAQIPVPPLELQQQFAVFVQQIDKSKFAIQKSLEKAETLYKSLMQEYFG